MLPCPLPTWQDGHVFPRFQSTSLSANRVRCVSRRPGLAVNVSRLSLSVFACLYSFPPQQMVISCIYIVATWAIVLVPLHDTRAFTNGWSTYGPPRTRHFLPRGEHYLKIHPGNSNSLSNFALLIIFCTFLNYVPVSNSLPSIFAVSIARWPTSRSDCA